MTDDEMVEAGTFARSGDGESSAMTIPEQAVEAADGWFLPREALNEPQIATLEKFLAHAKRAHEIDCKIREDAVETWYELDFIKHMRPAAQPLLWVQRPEDVARVEVVECVQLEGLDPNAPAPDMYRVIIKDGETERCFDFDYRVTADLLARTVNGNCSYRPSEGSPEWYRIRERRDALRPAPQAGCAKEGWQLVPRTTADGRLVEMWEAGNNSIEYITLAEYQQRLPDLIKEHGPGCRFPLYVDMPKVYAAILSASPPPPVAESGWQEIDPELTEFLGGVVGVVEANDYERMCLWQEHTKHGGTWQESLFGHGRTIGLLDSRPVHVSLLVDKVDGHRILFIDPTSQVIDHQQIERWLIAALPTPAKKNNGEFVNKVDAMNFHNVFHSLPAPPHIADERGKS